MSRDDYKDFDKDLREGLAREDAFVHVLLRSRVEHKHDKKSAETGNLAFEFEQRNKEGIVVPSGIARTDAERWAHEFRDDCWLILPVEYAKELARAAIKDKREVWCGNGNNHHNALVPFGWAHSGPPRDARLRSVA